MGLSIPVVGGDSGPAYGIYINNSLTLIDQHDHSSGKGVQITPAGMNISANLAMAGNNLITTRSVRFSAQTAAFSNASTSADIGCVYNVNGDLYFSDGSARQVQITTGGGVAGTPGAISNLTSPASASYVSGTPAFVFQSAANTAASLDGRNITLRNSAANSKGMTIVPPSAMASDATVTLPAVPGSTQFLTMDATGAMGNVAVAAGITNSMIAAVNYVTSTSSGNFSSSATGSTSVMATGGALTTTGKPVMVMLSPVGGEGDAGTSYIGVSNTSNTGGLISAYFYLTRGTSLIGSWYVSSFVQGNALMQITTPAFSVFDVVGAGAYSYSLLVRCASAAQTVYVNNFKIVAQELK